MNNILKGYFFRDKNAKADMGEILEKSRVTEATLESVEGKLEVIAPHTRHPHIANILTLS